MNEPDLKSPLYKFVTADDPRFSWKLTNTRSHETLRLVSQTWKGQAWEHDIVVCHSKSDQRSNPDSRLPTPDPLYSRPNRAQSHTWVLHITGSDPNEFDIDWSQHLADTSGCSVAILFHIPNQPIWDLKEDDLIAHTFEKFLDDGDETWPLLFPMVKSAVMAMDALEEFVGSGLKFVVFGASKRGWTSWLTAATGDPRVVGIAPMLFDSLKMTQQLEKQMRDWGEYSPMIEAYTSRNLDNVAESDLGRKLVAMVDPATYLPDIKVPVMMINGANDPYWTSDALSLFWDDIQGPKYVVTVPNLGHAFEMTEWWTPSLAAFVRLCCGGSWLGMELVDVQTWAAQSETLHFDQSVWATTVCLSSAFNLAEFQSSRYRWDGLEFFLTTPVVVKKGR